MNRVARRMILCIDVQYSGNKAFVAGLTFDRWEAELHEASYFTEVTDVGEYESGNFYKRELPCILSLLKEHQLSTDVIVVDGYVTLENNKPGLGKHLYDALHNKVEVIGVAKNPFNNVCENTQILRGISKKPLYITTTGNLDNAKQSICKMHGENRIPTLLKLVDLLCREKATQYELENSLRRNI